MFSLSKKIKQLLSSTMWKIAFILTIEALIAFLFLLGSNIYHLRTYRSTIISDCTKELNSYLNNNEDVMNTVLICAHSAANNPLIRSAGDAAEQLPYSDCLNVVSTLKNNYIYNDIVTSIAIYNQKADFVISDTGVNDTRAFFEQRSIYANYPLSYWQSFRGSPSSIAMLPSSSFTNEDDMVSTSIPLVSVLSKSADNYCSLLIFNISVDAIYNSFSRYKIFSDSMLYMIENSSSLVFTGTSPQVNNDMEQIVTDTVRRDLQSRTDVVRSNNTKYLSIRSTRRADYWGYTYLVLVPMHAINRSTYIGCAAALLFLLLLGFFLIMYISYGTRKLYDPWQSLTQNVKALQTEDYSGGESTDLSSYISSYLNSVSELNANLKQILTVSMPLGQERYIIDLLNGNYDPSESKSVMLSFEHDYFASVAASITINPDFFSDLPDRDPILIRSAINDSIRAFFSDRFITYSLPSSNNTLYLLLNLENDTCKDKIEETIDQIKKIVSVDADKLDIVFGCGNIYKGIDGLKLSHQESLFDVMSVLSSSKVQFPENIEHYIFTDSNKNLLQNYLETGQFDKAAEMLDSAFERIALISPSRKKYAYIDIITAMQSFMRKRNISTFDRRVQNVMHTLQTNAVVDDDKFRMYIQQLLNMIIDVQTKESYGLDVNAVVDYINNHYTDNLVLEDLAEEFNTSAKYLSKKIKQHLNITFKEYLTDLQIKKACELLTTTDITISELYWQVGFQNRNVFTRAFKLKTGLAPSEYKKRMQNKGKNKNNNN